jgi:uncharacterized protein (TIGR02001 family)
MKQLSMVLIASTVIVTSQMVMADSPHEFSANVALSTDYMYRGGSQTKEQPAISGGFDYAHSSGFYAGLWASNVDFGDSANIEIDYYGGVAGKFSNGIGWDVGGLYYQYPGVKDIDEAGGDFDFFEVNGSLEYEFSDVQLKPTVGTSFAWSPDYSGESGDSYYVTADLGLSLPYGIGFAFQYGNQMFDSSSMTDYSHYSVGLSKEVAKFNFDVTWYDEIDDANLFWNLSSDPNNTPAEALVFTVSASF